MKRYKIAVQCKSCNGININAKEPLLSKIGAENKLRKDKYIGLPNECQHCQAPRIIDGKVNFQVCIAKIPKVKPQPVVEVKKDD